MEKNKDEKKLIEILKKSGIIDKNIEKTDSMLSLPERIQQSILLLKKHEPKRHTMLYFIMYDIENNKVRRLIARYLEKKGLIRIQKSIFIADTPYKEFETIRQTLKEVQEQYDNHDSILLVPISADEVRSMKIIGKNIDIDLITGNTDVLIF